MEMASRYALLKRREIAPASTTSSDRVDDWAGGKKPRVSAQPPRISPRGRRNGLTSRRNKQTYCEPECHFDKGLDGPQSGSKAADLASRRTIARKLEQSSVRQSAWELNKDPEGDRG